MVRWDAYPKAIKEGKNATITKKAWDRMHRKDQMFSAVFCAPPGTGKSSSAIELADELDRCSDNKPRFDVSRIALNAEEFASLVKKKWPKGTCIILDDAGLSLYSREAMTESVRNISKIFQSIRFKNLCILLTLPNFNMLDANVRRLVSCYIEVLEIDRQKNQTICKFNWLQSNPHSGKIYRHREEVYKTVVCPTTGISMRKKFLLSNIRIDKPRKELFEPYEKKKANCMNKAYAEFHKKMIEKKNGKEKRKSLLDDYRNVLANIDLYKKNNGKLSTAKLQLAGMTTTRSRKLVELYNDEDEDIEELVKRQKKAIKSRYHRLK